MSAIDAHEQAFGLPLTSPELSGNLADLLANTARRNPGGAALIFNDEVTSWAELAAQAASISAGLRSLGLQDGDRVAMVLGNVPDFPAAYFGILGAGLVAVPLNPTLTFDERAHVLEDCGVSAVIGAGHEAAELSALVASRSSIPRLVLTGEGPAGVPVLAALGEGLAPIDRRGGGEDLAVVVYTSGTSGRPRGAMLTHRALLANLEQSAAVRPPLVEADDVLLLVLPMFHIYGLNAGLGLAVRTGATAVLAERFEPVDSLRLMSSHDVTVVVGAPPMYVAWSMLPDAERAFATVRLAISGAAPLPPSLLTRMLGATGHHIFEGYGLTETAPVLTTTLMSEAAKAGSIGKPLPGIELRLADAGDLIDASEEDIAGEVGIIEVRGANLFNGYWPDGQGGPDAEGWWSTGDVAFADDDGDLHLIDRARELILVSGFNVYPREVESVLDANPGIRESAVLGIPHPYTGQSVKAVVVLEPGSTLTAEEVINWAAASLARFKCPTAVQFIDRLPHTQTGKVSKGQLRALAGEPG